MAPRRLTNRSAFSWAPRSLVALIIRNNMNFLFRLFLSCFLTKTKLLHFNKDIMCRQYLEKTVLVEFREGAEALVVVGDPGDPLHGEPVARDGGAHRDGDAEHAAGGVSKLSNHRLMSEDKS